LARELYRKTLAYIASVHGGGHRHIASTTENDGGTDTKARFVVWYRELKSLEDEIWRTKQPSNDLLVEWRDEIEELDAQASRISVPMRYLRDVYALKQAISVVRERIAMAGVQLDERRSPL
jgi:hypothetical protein